MSNSSRPQPSRLRRAGQLAWQVGRQVLTPDGIPDDVARQLEEHAQAIWEVRGALLQELMGVVYPLIAQGLPPMQALHRGARRLNLRTRPGVARRAGPGRPGMSDVQVRQYHRRQQQRGRRPGQNPQMSGRRQREAEFELALTAAAETLAEGEAMFGWLRSRYDWARQRLGNQSVDTVTLYHYSPNNITTAIRPGAYWTDFGSRNRQDVARITGRNPVEFNYQYRLTLSREERDRIFDNRATKMIPGLPAADEYQNLQTIPAGRLRRIAMNP